MIDIGLAHATRIVDEQDDVGPTLAFDAELKLRQEDGALNFIYKTTEPMAFQPALANGNLYAGTNNGLLICLKTGDPDADGWTAWGGNAQHNKTQMKGK